MKIREILELNKEKKMPIIAKDHLPIGEKKLYSILKEIGCKPVLGKREWDYENVSETDLEKDITEFVRVTAIQAKRTNERKKETTKEEKSEIVKEEKNIPTNERNHDNIKEQNKKPTNKEKDKMRKRASFDIDSALLKELKIYAITEEKNVYEIVENAIRTYLQERK